MTRIPKRPRDPNQLAKFIVDTATADDDVARQPQEEKPVSPATEFARLGGLKGGKARAEALSAERRREIATKGSTARWNKSGDKN